MPSTMLAGQTAEEVWGTAPVTQTVKTGDKFVIELPSGSSADASSMEIFINDIDGPGTPKISLKSPEYSATTNKLKFTFSIDEDGDGTEDAAATASNFQAEFAFSHFTLPSEASSYDYQTGNGGVYATYSTQAADKSPIETIGQTAPFNVEAGGSGQIDVIVLDAADNQTPIEGVEVFIDSYKSGLIFATTDAQGKASFTGLPTSEGVGSEWGVDYFVGVEPGDGYVASGTDTSSYLDDSYPTDEKTFLVNSATATVNVTFDYGAILDEDIDFIGEAYGLSSPMFTETTFTADHTKTSASFTLGLITGEWEICAFPDMKMETMKVDNEYTDILLPCETLEVVDGTDAYDVTLSITKADASISGTVTDDNGDAITNGHVYAYQPSGGYYGGDSDIDSNGGYSISLKGGEQYTVVFERNGNMQEKSVFVDDNEKKTDVDFSARSYDIIISGNVTGADKDANINIYGDYGFFAWDQSDPDTGAWAISVPDGITIFVEAHSYKGMLDADSAYATNGQHVIDVDGSNVTGINFAYDTAAFGTISGSVSPAVADMTVCAEEVYLNGNYAHNSNCTGTDSEGNFSISVARNAGGSDPDTSSRYNLFAWSSSYVDISYEGVDISSSDASGIVLTAGDLHEVKVQINNIPIGVTEGYLDIYDPSSYQGRDKPLTFTTTTKSTTVYLPDGDYDSWLWIPGFGGVNPEVGSPVRIDSDMTMTFDLSSISQDLETINVKVLDPNGDPLEHAYVEAFEFATGTYVGGETDSNGDVTLYAKVSSNLNFRADHPDYSSKKTSKTAAELEADNNVEIQLGSQKNSTVSVTITGTFPDLFAEITDEDGEFWNGTPVGGDGTATLNVPDDLSDLILRINSSDGSYREKTGVDPGDSVVMSYSTFESPSSWVQTATSAAPKTQASTANGLAMKDSNNNVNITVTAGNVSSSSFSAQVQTVANTARSGLDYTPIIGKQVKFLDADGDVITDITGTFDLEITITKDMMEAAKTDGIYDSYDDLLTIALGYWDSSTSSWVSEITTRSAYVKANSGSSWTAIELQTMVDNLKTNSSYYYDWKVVLKASPDHTTIFSPLTGSDSTPPSAPADLTASATTSQVVLDWTDNSEGDLLEYEIYRSTSSPVGLTDENQVNSSAVTSSTFTDTTVSADTTYYYAVTAVDTSGNESSSTEKSATTSSDSTTTTTTTPSTAGGTSSGDANVSDDDDEDDSSDDSDDTADTTEEASGWTSEEHDEIDESDTTTTDYEGHWAIDYISTVIDAGIAQGVTDTEFEPNRYITRAEMAKMVVIAFGYEVPDSVSETEFSDITVTDWYAKYVETAREHELVAGYGDGTFAPANYINRAEALKILIEAYLTDEEIEAIETDGMPFTDVNATVWYAPYISYSYENGIVQGYSDTEFAPGNNITRAEFCKIIVELLEL